MGSPVRLRDDAGRGSPSARSEPPGRRSALSYAGWLALGLVGLLLVGGLDYLTGYEFALSILYLVPILSGTWTLGRNTGLALSVVGALVWLVADQLAAPPYAHPLIGYWNAGVQLGFFLVTTYLLSRLKQALERETRLASLDPLTGVLNRRGFLLAAEAELNRVRRYRSPLSLAYIDLDNFKTVNDSWGHRTGDNALRVVGEIVRSRARAPDVVARLGGDEFALLLPETTDTAAVAVLRRLRQALLDAMRAHGWPVTFSIGVATFLAPVGSVDELIKAADELMYSVKNTGRDMIKARTFGV